MRKMLFVAAWFVASLPAVAVAADLGNNRYRDQSYEPRHQKWAAVAVSTDTRKDAYGFQYEKDSASGAEADAIRSCEDRFALKGIRGGHCAVKSSTEYVVGIYCRNGRHVAGIGTGRSPEEASSDALDDVRHANVRACDFKVMRHGTQSKHQIESGPWTAAVECGSRNYAARASGAMNALNAAFRQCGDTGVDRVRVQALNLN